MTVVLYISLPLPVTPTSSIHHAMNPSTIHHRLFSSIH